MAQINDVIISKLDSFIRKYYMNKLIRGVLYCAILLLSFFILLNVIEYFGYYSILFRSVTFYLYILLALIFIVLFIIRPLLKMCKLGKRISYTDAANIIGEFFPEVSDKLINLLQLKDRLNESESEFLLASISQKTIELKPIPFVRAIDFSKNKKFYKWLFIPVTIIVLIFVFYPSLISEPAYRYINHSKYFQKPAPFNYKLLNNNLKVIQHDDIEIKVVIEGNALPRDVYIVVNNQRFHMKKERRNLFSYSFKCLQTNALFYFEASGVKSKDYELEVLPKPILLEMQAFITYPPYTKMKEENFVNVSNFSVPKGSVIRWQIVTKDTKKLIFDFQDTKVGLLPDKNGRLNYSKKVLEDIYYRIFTQNEYSLFSDSLSFSISVIPDLFPQIAVIEQKDSLVSERVYFRGQIKDDYGFSNLEFHIERYVKDGSDKKVSKKMIALNKEEKSQEFYYYYNLNEEEIKPGDRIVYYFEVWDNDAVNGVKSARSSSFVFEVPSLQEIEKMTQKTSNEINKETDGTISQLQKLQQEIKEFNKKLLEKKDVNWQDRKQLNELLQKQQNIKDKLQEISKKIKENNSLEQKYKKQNEEITRKQKELERLFNEVMSDEMKRLFEEMKKLADKQMDKEKLKDALEKMTMSNEDMQKQLDRNLEMYKRLEVEKKMQQAIDKLNELSKDQEQLSDESFKNPKDNSLLQKKQEDLNKSFEELRQNLDILEKKSSLLDLPQDIKRDNDREKGITKDQNSAQKQLENDKNKDASKSQKSASEKMKKMSEQMQEQKDKMQQEQLAEDVEEVRLILKNLVKSSLAQEELMSKVKQTSVSDPSYQTIINQQNKIKDDMKMISDTLFAISKRQPQIGTQINKELSAIELQLDKSVATLLQYNQSIYGSYKNTSAAIPQQYVMTSMNNLALMLAESLDQMQSQMKSNNNSKSKSNKQKNQCNNPSSIGKKPTPTNMRQMQEALNKEIERLRKELEDNKASNQGKPKIGENAKINEELARMAAQQEMIRKMMQQYANEVKQEEGKANGQIDNLLKQMEQVEEDIVNKIISQQTIQRQNNILTRMLEHEKSQKKKEQEERRESVEGIDRYEQGNSQFIEFNKLKSRELELFKQIPPVFSPYYKEKVNDYFLKSSR